MPLASPPGRPDVVYGFGRIDASGRVADHRQDQAASQAPLAASGPSAGTRTAPQQDHDATAAAPSLPGSRKAGI